MSAESTNKNIWACILYAFGFLNSFSSNVFFFLFCKYIRSQHVGNENKPTKTCPFPTGSLRSPDERTVPLLQIVYVLPMKFFCCRYIILSLQRYDYFQDRCLIISRNSDMGLIFCTATSGRNCPIKIKNVPIWSHLPLLPSFPPHLSPPRKSGFLEPPSLSFLSLCPSTFICSHLCFRKHSHRPLIGFLLHLLLGFDKFDGFQTGLLITVIGGSF